MMIEKILKIEDMHCKKCTAKVENVLLDIQGVKAIVNLEENRASVFSEKDINDLILIEAVESVGFKTIEIN
ncbi:MAG: heavy metal-associated domain-containing protein [Paludibacter sp.]|nr:heavy metal-associated domain-containing protein [Paludibacter sp.]